LLKKIVNYSDYTISNNGCVYRNGKEISSYDNGTGYIQVKLSKDGDRKSFYVHRLVYRVFIGPINGEINHKDHNKKNNRLYNLEDISHGDNLKKAAAKIGAWGSAANIKSDNLYYQQQRKLTLSQASDTSLEGAETSGEVQSS